jgi:GNAT superfamily N-acetyltransferase
VETTNISFETICHIWQKHLWQNRVSPIETHSAMTWPYDGNPLEFDMDIFDYTPSFFGVFHNGRVIGVNSGHRTKDNIYRSRGIWVHPDHRKKGVSKMLFDATEKQARNEGCNMIWSIPRKSALPAYTKFGFETVGDFFDEGMEFGPNIYVTKELDVSN